MFFMINLDKKYRKISFLIKTINNGTRHTIEFGGVLALERVQEKEAPPTCRFFYFYKLNGEIKIFIFRVERKN